MTPPSCIYPPGAGSQDRGGEKDWESDGRFPNSPGPRRWQRNWGISAHHLFSCLLLDQTSQDHCGFIFLCHFPTNSLSEAAGQVINHRERERRGKRGRPGEGRAGPRAEGGLRAQMPAARREGARGRGREGGGGCGEGHWGRKTHRKGGKEIKRQRVENQGG